MTTTAPPPTASTTTADPRPSAPRRRRMGTTPGRLRLLSILGVAAILVLLVVGAGALSSRRDAARSVAEESGPDLVAINDLFRALADADAVASSALLRAGDEPATDRSRYLDDLDDAGRLLTDILARSDLSPEGRRAARTIAQALPFYAGRVESARANIRFGYPLGAEYMRSASSVMQDQILPAAATLFETAGSRLGDDYDSGTSSSQIAWIVVIGVATLGVLLVTLVYTARRTNRIVNVGVAGAAVIVVVLLAWAGVRFTTEQDALATAQREGSDAIQVLATGRILTLQAQAAANLGLAERGTGAEFLGQYKELIRRLGGADCRGGILADTRAIAARTGDSAQVDAISERCADYVSVQQQVRALDDDGQFKQASVLALADGGAAAAELDDVLASEIARAQRRFDAAAADARVGFGILAFALVAGLVLAAVLVMVGLQRRIGEYR